MTTERDALAQRLYRAYIGGDRPTWEQCIYKDDWLRVADAAQSSRDEIRKQALHDAADECEPECNLLGGEVGKTIRDRIMALAASPPAPAPAGWVPKVGDRVVRVEPTVFEVFEINDALYGVLARTTPKCDPSTTYFFRPEDLRPATPAELRAAGIPGAGQGVGESGRPTHVRVACGSRHDGKVLPVLRYEDGIYVVTDPDGTGDWFLRDGDHCVPASPPGPAREGVADARDKWQHVAEGLERIPGPHDGWSGLEEFIALPAADMERLLAADALRVVHHRDPGTPSAAALAYAETFLRENGYYDDGTPTRTFALALDDFARAALGGAK